MKRYRNKVTGAIIAVTSKISGENWEEVKEQGEEKKSSPPARKRTAGKARGKQDG